MNKHEIRTHLGDIEFRGADEGRSMVASGYASVFNTRSQNLGGFVEEIKPGAFTKTLKEGDIRALFNHDTGALLGRTASGTLRLNQDERGLAYTLSLPDTQLGRDTAVLLERGDISGSSFGFRVISDDWGTTENGYPLRSVQELALKEVSLVTFPAYLEAEVALRSLAEQRALDPDEVLRAASENSLAEILSAKATDENRTEVEESQEAPTPFRHRGAHLI